MFAAAVFCLGQTKDNILSVFRVQTEAQADGPPVVEEEEEAPGEDGGGSWKGWRKGYKHTKVADWKGFRVSWPPSMEAELVDCCKKSSEMNACNMEMESPRCRYLTY